MCDLVQRLQRPIRRGEAATIHNSSLLSAIVNNIPPPPRASSPHPRVLTFNLLTLNLPRTREVEVNPTSRWLQRLDGADSTLIWGFKRLAVGPEAMQKHMSNKRKCWQRVEGGVWETETEREREKGECVRAYVCVCLSVILKSRKYMERTQLAD